MNTPVNRDSSLIRLTEELYSIQVGSVQEFERQHKDPVVNLVLTSVNGDRYFLKQIQPHSMRPELEEIYSRLGGLKTEGYRLILPLLAESGKALFEHQGVPFVLMKFEEITPFSSSRVACAQMLSILSDFHAKVSGFPIERQSHRTFEGWLRRGSEQIRTRFGDGMPFIAHLEEYLRERFPAFTFREGIIHWDVHRHNFGIGTSGELLILVFDLLQPGALACDLLLLAPIYRDHEQSVISIAETVLDLVLSEVKKVTLIRPGSAAAAFGRRDLKFLVGRRLMMDVWDWSEVDARKNEVSDYLKEIEIWVKST